METEEAKEELEASAENRNCVNKEESEEQEEEEESEPQN